MSLPHRFPTAVSILFTSEDEPLLVRARATGAVEDLLDIELPEGAPVCQPGMAVILDFPSDSGGGRAIAAVETQAGALLKVRIMKLPKSDLREFPRMMGGIDLRYLVGKKSDVAAWLDGSMSGKDLRAPDPFMSFSTGGFAFDDIETCSENDLLFIDFMVPGHPSRFRATASVVRVSRIPIDERDEAVEATHRVAVAFEDISTEARESLVEHTARLQEAFL